MSRQLPRLALRTVALLGAMLCTGVRADIVIAQVSPFSGPVRATGEAYYAGAKACFDRVNGEGGIGGQKIVFVREDDSFKPEETVRLFRVVAQRDRPVAFVNLLGAANAGALLSGKVIDGLAIPVVGVTPGAESSRNPGSPYLFHVQAGDRAQLKAILTHLAAIGLKKVALIHHDNPAGFDTEAYVKGATPSLGMEMVGSTKVRLGEQDLAIAAAELKKSNAQAYMVTLAPGSASAFVRDARAKGDKTPTYALSYISAQEIVARAGLEGAQGVALAQISPNASAGTTGLVREFQATMKQYAPASHELSSSSLAGFIAAKVLVDGLVRAGNKPTAQSLTAALKATKVDLGGYRINMAQGNVGSQFVDIAVIDQAGKLRY
jgi:branched-chain amino acid transport system substrate-binding protein